MNANEKMMVAMEMMKNACEEMKNCSGCPFHKYCGNNADVEYASLPESWEVEKK